MMASIGDSPDTCVVCLASNIALWPLGEYTHLYKMLLGKENDLENTDMKPFLCSDCQDMFRKIEIFQQKIRKSQNTLLKKLTEDPQLTGNQKTELKIEYQKHTAYIEINTSSFKADEGCKDEPFDNDSIGFDIEDTVIEDIKKEPCDIDEKNDDKIEFKVTIEHEVKDENTEKPTIYANDSSSKKKYPRKKVSFNIVSGSELLNRNYRYYTKKRCDAKELKKMDERVRGAWSYRNSKYKCQTCVRGFKENEAYQNHLLTKHSESVGPLTCDLCGIRTATKRSMEIHVRQHYYKYTCVLCDHTTYKKWQLRVHFLIRHKKLYECPKCGILITKRREYYRHYKMMHQRFICDYCGKLYTDRRWFENHILKIHTKFECKPCNKTFLYYKNFDAHNKLLHTTAISESTYCVECDIQFENQTRYARHITNSTKHLGRNRKKSATCPECGKFYVCRTNMMNHYRLEHLKVTNYQCQDCNRFFLNSFRLKEHRLVNHEKKGRVKNKICSYCGRGFSNNRILLYHVRTHTGERPHGCMYCSATFAQPFALATHVKARHKDVLK